MAWRWPPTPSSADVKERVGRNNRTIPLLPLLAFVVCHRVKFTVNSSSADVKERVERNNRTIPLLRLLAFVVCHRVKFTANSHLFQPSLSHSTLYALRYFLCKKTTYTSLIAEDLKLLWITRLVKELPNNVTKNVFHSFQMRHPRCVLLIYVPCM